MVSPNQMPPLARVIGRDKPVAALLSKACEDERFQSIQIHGIDANRPDEAQIDPGLLIEEPIREADLADPRPGTSYAGMTPQQRFCLTQWLSNPAASAPNAFRTIYVAHLETNLFESIPQAHLAHQELLRLAKSEAWQDDTGIHRALLLSYWLRQDGDGLLKWLSAGYLPTPLVGVALGHLAMLQQSLTVDLLQCLSTSWSNVNSSNLSTEMLALRLGSLTASLDQEPLSYALSALAEDNLEAGLWRCSHRYIRISLPQPDLTTVLKPLIVEAIETLDGAGVADTRSGAEEVDDEIDGSMGWSLVLEFSHSRSEYFDFALTRARQRPDYTQILDEDRKLVYRVNFVKREMRHFWLLWEYVQNWSNTRVYLNGEELEKWKIWPYSQYLR